MNTSLTSNQVILDEATKQLLEKTLKSLNQLPNFMVPEANAETFRDTYSIASAINKHLRPKTQDHDNTHS